MGMSYNDGRGSPEQQIARGAGSLFSCEVNQTVPKHLSTESISSESEAGASASEHMSTSGISSGSSVRIPFEGWSSPQSADLDTGVNTAESSLTSQRSIPTWSESSHSPSRSQEYTSRNPRVGLSGASAHQAESIQGLYHAPGDQRHNHAIHSAQNVSKFGRPEVPGEISVMSGRALPRFSPRGPFDGRSSPQSSELVHSAESSLSSQSSTSTLTESSHSDLRSQDYPPWDPRMVLSAASGHQADSIQGLYHAPGDQAHNPGVHNAQNISQFGCPDVPEEISVISGRSLRR